jgi:hypothetical protein
MTRLIGRRAPDLARLGFLIYDDRLPFTRAPAP